MLNIFCFYDLLKNILRRLVFLFILIILDFQQSHANFINPNETWFAAEPTFQDQVMVDEPGRLTLATTHKQMMFETFYSRLIKYYNAQKTATISKINNEFFKPGVRISIPENDTFIVDMEPVCIEINKSPMRFFEQAENWRPVFKVAAEIGLVGYVNPAAERSGMGHIHVGGPKVALNPFFAHPRLLRNVMVYFHQHPSLMWGFAEAFDIGANSNIESLHNDTRQVKFAAAVAEFDQWYLASSPSERIDGGFKFLSLLEKHGGYDFFQHYRLINLQHVRSLANSNMAKSGEQTGKYTVEFRGIRPYRTAEHLQAMAEFLYLVMDYLANPNLTVPFISISSANYANFHGAIKTAADWIAVKKELNLAKVNPLVDEMQMEYFQNMLEKAVLVPSYKGMKALPAYSEKEKKGSYVEISLQRIANTPMPIIKINDTPINLEALNFMGENLWVGVVKANELHVSPSTIFNGQALQFNQPHSCREAIAIDKAI